MSSIDSSDSSHSSIEIEDSHDDVSHHSSISGDSQLNDHRHQSMSLPIRTESNVILSSPLNAPKNSRTNSHPQQNLSPILSPSQEAPLKVKDDSKMNSSDLRTKMCAGDDDEDDQYAVQFNDRFKNPGLSFANTTLPAPLQGREEGRRRSRSKSFSEQVKNIIRPKDGAQHSGNSNTANATSGILLGRGNSESGIHSHHHHHQHRIRGNSNASHEERIEFIKAPSNAGLPGALLTKLSSRTSSERRKSFSRENNNDDSDLDSHASRESQETEEDVCFPMVPEHVRVQGIDFSELDEFIQEQREENEVIAKREEELKYSNNVTTSRDKFSSAALKYTPKFNTSPSNESQKSFSNIQEKRSEVGSSTDGEIGVTFDPEENKFEALPTRFSFFNSEREETIHAADLTTLIGPNESMKCLFEQQDSIWWLDCTCPTDNEVKVIAKAFGIHPLTAEDIRMQETREKVELFKSYYFVCFHTFETDPESEDFLEPINVYIVVFKTGMLTFHFSPIVNPANVRRRVRQLRDYVNVSADWLCYAMIDDITDGFAPIIHAIEYEADAIEDSVFSASDNDFGRILLKIGESRRKVMTLMRLLQGKADVIKMFSKRCQEAAADGSSHPAQPRADIALYLGDIQDHIITMFQSLLSYEKIFSRSHTNYLAQLQVESFYANNRVTDILSKVTMIGTIMVPMNLVTGLFGMNVKVPGQDGSNFGWFGGIIGFIFFMILVSCLFVHIYMNRVNNVSDSILPPLSVNNFKFGRKRNNDTAERRNREEMVSLPTKFTRYGEW